MEYKEIQLIDKNNVPLMPITSTSQIYTTEGELLQDELTNHETRIEALEQGGGGGGSTVTIADNPTGGVDLTVNGTTKTLANQSSLAGLDVRINTNAEEISTAENNIVRLGGTVDELETEVSTIKEDLLSLNTEVENHETRITAIEQDEIGEKLIEITLEEAVQTIDIINDKLTILKEKPFVIWIENATENRSPVNSNILAYRIDNTGNAHLVFQASSALNTARKTYVYAQSNSLENGIAIMGSMGSELWTLNAFFSYLERDSWGDRNFKGLRIKAESNSALLPIGTKIIIYKVV